MHSVVHMSTAVHNPRNHTVGRPLAAERPKSDGLFVHRKGRGKKLADPLGAVSIASRTRAFDAVKRSLDTPITPLVTCAR